MPDINLTHPYTKEPCKGYLSKVGELANAGYEEGELIVKTYNHTDNQSIFNLDQFSEEEGQKLINHWNFRYADHLDLSQFVESVKPKRRVKWIPGKVNPLFDIQNYDSQGNEIVMVVEEF